MKCQEVMELMQRHLDADLNEEENKALEEHLNTCASCTQMFERLQLLSAELVNLPKVTPPISIVDSIMPTLNEIDEQKKKHTEKKSGTSRKRGQFKYGWGKTAAGIAVAALLLFVAINQLPQLTSHEIADTAMDQSNVYTEAEDMEIAVSEKKETSGYMMDDKLASTGNNRMGQQNEIQETQQESDVVQPEQSTTESLGITPLTFDASLQEMPSPDGTYIGWIETLDEGFQVVVSDQDEQRIFESSVKKGESIMNLNWSEDSSTLSYDVIVDGEKVATYMIDIKNGTEVEQK